MLLALKRINSPSREQPPRKPGLRPHDIGRARLIVPAVQRIIGTFDEHFAPLHQGSG